MDPKDQKAPSEIDLLKAENARLKAEVAQLKEQLDTKERLKAVGEPAEVIALQKEKMAAGLDPNIALICARNQYNHNLALAEAAKKTASEKPAKAK